MTLFAAEAVAETPSWMLAHHTLSVPDVLPSTKDPSVRQRWVEDAEWQRDQTPRPFRLLLRADGRTIRCWEIEVSPSVAWWWFTNTVALAGERLVLVDPAKPNLLEDTDEECKVCDEVRPSLAYDAHRKHQEASNA